MSRKHKWIKNDDTSPFPIDAAPRKYLYNKDNNTRYVLYTSCYQWRCPDCDAAGIDCDLCGGIGWVDGIGLSGMREPIWEDLR